MEKFLLKLYAARERSNIILLESLRGTPSLAFGERAAMYFLIPFLVILLTCEGYLADDYLNQCQIVPDPLNLRDLYYMCFHIRNRVPVIS